MERSVAVAPPRAAIHETEYMFLLLTATYLRQKLRGTSTEGIDQALSVRLARLAKYLRDFEREMQDESVSRRARQDLGLVWRFLLGAYVALGQSDERAQDLMAQLPELIEELQTQWAKAPMWELGRLLEVAAQLATVMPPPDVVRPEQGSYIHWFGLVFPADLNPDRA